MDKYFIKRKTILEEPSNVNTSDAQPNAKKDRIELNIDDLPSDPGLRKKVSDYHPNDRDKVRRAYLQKGPCQPYTHNFPQKKIGNALRHFNPTWFKEYGNWLEYSIEKDAAFCLCCYLYRPDVGEQASGDSFVLEGFTNWKKKERFDIHVGGPNSAHNQAWKRCQDLLNQKQHIQFAFAKQSDQARENYRVRLTATLDCIRFLLCQGLAFRGSDETESSHNQGNFLELLKFLANHNETIKSVVLENAPGNSKSIAHDIQKDIVHAAVIETTNSRDVSVKEQAAIALRYVDSKGHVIEHFLGLVHVSDTTALSLKATIEAVFSKNNLSTSKIRGQGYDGASNMQGEFNGLKTLIMKVNASAYYVHCFAHQLQLALVAVVKNHVQIALLFNTVTSVVNIVGVSCKRRDALREKQFNKIVEALRVETSLQRAGDTRWGSHYGSLINLIIMFGSVIDVLEIVVEDGISLEQRGEAFALLDLVQSFDFVFNLHLMKNVLGITNELSMALQRRDQDIVNAMALVKVTKQRLQTMRDDGWKSLYDEVSSFCERNNIVVPNMDDIFVTRGRPRRNTHKVTNLHHYRVELFYTVVDMQLQELNNRFNELNMELLLCVASLSPCDSFAAFDKGKLIRLAQFYPSEFSETGLHVLDNQLETYVIDLRSHDEFKSLKGINELSIKLVETKKHIVYPLVYLLVKLALILSVSTASVERVFSAMKIVKNRLRNRMGDSWMNDCLITYIEKEIFCSIDNEKILHHFQTMKTRREQL
ncbi:hypothetical protein J5N97_025968 [Dioscorea zingiberensis]|uniref:TTF-type domain-containing protein n=1 Tax=Dioscorea zingiberensis TaxID=325984 RepID=A0A9D5H6B0_9LILI|nr:hypothetical protein J5N97_025968 [Dioscorea zingiberensis]